MRENQLRTIVHEFKRAHHHLLDGRENFLGTCKCSLARNGTLTTAQKTIKSFSIVFPVQFAAIVLREYVACVHCTYNHDVIP